MTLLVVTRLQAPGALSPAPSGVPRAHTPYGARPAAASLTHTLPHGRNRPSPARSQRGCPAVGLLSHLVCRAGPPLSSPPLLDFIWKDNLTTYGRHFLVKLSTIPAFPANLPPTRSRLRYMLGFSLVLTVSPCSPHKREGGDRACREETAVGS